MVRSRRVAAAAYLEVFLLIAIAAAGSAVVLEAGFRSVTVVQGASLSVSRGGIHQGAYVAVETLLVQNTGDVPFDSFEVSTSGVSNGSTYCYALYDPVSLSRGQATCPSMSPGAGAADIPAKVSPGRAVLVELDISGRAFSAGSVSTVTVTTSAGSQETIDVVVVPA